MTGYLILRFYFSLFAPVRNPWISKAGEDNADFYGFTNLKKRR